MSNYIAIGKKYLNEAQKYLNHKTMRQIIIVTVLVGIGFAGFQVIRIAF